MDLKKVLHIARACHEVNRVYCQALGDTSQPPWEEAPEWQQNSAVLGVRTRLEWPTLTPREMHEGWSAQKLRDGWKWGPVKDVVKKEHPCLVPFEELSAEQQAKDTLFSAVVDGLRHVDVL